MDYSTQLQEVMTFMTTWGIRVIGALAVFIIGKMVASWGRRMTRRGLEKGKTDATLIPFISSLVYYLLLAFVIIAVLGIFGIPTASFVAILGAAGLAVGLALQGTLSNFAAGVMLMVFRPFKLGDFVRNVGAESPTWSAEVEAGARNFVCSAGFIESSNETVIILHDITEIKRLAQMKKDLDFMVIVVMTFMKREFF